MSTIILPDVDYPTGDGKPMAETPVHRVNMTDSIAMLEGWFGERQDVYISGNMLLYYVEGDPRRHVSPDVFVVLGIPQVYRPCYKTWEESKPTLDFVIEFTSSSTRGEDQKTKRELYRTVLGVREYCLFDPFGEYLKPSAQLYRLVDGEYVAVKPVNGRLPSEVLDLHIDRRGDYLRFWDPVAQELLLTPTERAEQQTAIAEQQTAIAEHERLRAEELRRRAEEQQRRADEEHRRAEEERQRAEQERLRAEKALAQSDQERTRADAAQALAARLQAELEALKERPKS